MTYLFETMYTVCVHMFVHLFICQKTSPRDMHAHPGHSSVAAHVALLWHFCSVNMVVPHPLQIEAGNTVTHARGSIIGSDLTYSDEMP